MKRAQFVTFADFGKQWTSGQLARDYPDHVTAKTSAGDDESRLRRYVYPVIGDQTIAAFDGNNGVALVEQVLTALPSELSPATRRHIIQAVNRLLTLATYPAKLISANPLPKGFVPRLRNQTRAKSYLYPDEDRQLLACTRIALLDRVFYGLLAREGLRVSELLGLAWKDVDLQHGTVHLDENKTDDPRGWALDSGVIEALRSWKSIVGAGYAHLVLETKKRERLDPVTSARRLRSYLHKAGVDRPQLFEDSATRMPIRAHDLRATFITVSLALGKTETWVMDRTGHRSSQMINLYRRRARSNAEANLGALEPLHMAIPELRPPTT